MRIVSLYLAIIFILISAITQAETCLPKLDKDMYEYLIGLDDQDRVEVVLACEGNIGQCVSELEKIGMEIQGMDSNRIRAKAYVWQIKKVLPADWLERVELINNKRLAPALMQERQRIRMEIDCSCLPIDYVSQLEGVGARIVEVRDNAIVAEAADKDMLSKVGQLSFVMRVVWWDILDIREKIGEEDMWLLDLPDNEVIGVRLIMAVADTTIEDMGLDVIEKGDGWVDVRCRVDKLKRIVEDNRITKVLAMGKKIEGEM